MNSEEVSNWTSACRPFMKSEVHLKTDCSQLIRLGTVSVQSYMIKVPLFFVQLYTKSQNTRKLEKNVNMLESVIGSPNSYNFIEPQISDNMLKVKK